MKTILLIGIGVPLLIVALGFVIGGIVCENGGYMVRVDIIEVDGEEYKCEITKWNAGDTARCDDGTTFRHLTNYKVIGSEQQFIEYSC